MDHQRPARVYTSIDSTVSTRDITDVLCGKENVRVHFVLADTFFEV